MTRSLDDTMNLAYPLQWPEGVPRTLPHRRESSRFQIEQFGRARGELVRQIELLGSNYIVISTNVPVRGDGLPYATAREPDDPGVCVYFDLDGTQKSMACDRWDKLIDNVWALAKTIEAMRGIERWGSSEIMKRAFQAFGALPPASPAETVDWRVVFELPPYLAISGVPRTALAGFVKERFRELAQKNHPDHGGTDEAMRKVNAAYEAAKAELRF